MTGRMPCEAPSPYPGGISGFALRRVRLRVMYARALRGTTRADVSIPRERSRRDDATTCGACGTLAERTGPSESRLGPRNSLSLNGLVRMTGPRPFLLPQHQPTRDPSLRFDPSAGNYDTR